VVGKTFDEIVMDPTKDVFVKYFEGLSDAGKKFAPKWVQLANSVPDMTFGVFDVKQNEAENAHTEFNSYPTLVLYKKSDKKGIVYEGEKSVYKI